MFLKTLGLDPDNTLMNVVALLVFYVGAVLLAYVLYAFSLWRASSGKVAVRAAAAKGGAKRA